MTGGTALSAVYYNHRDSEDLDFFSPNNFKSIDISQWILSTKKELGWQRVSLDVKYPVNIYILKWTENDILRLDFNVYAFPRLKKGRTVAGIEVDSLTDIAVNKLDTILTRKKARDYVDLYMIMKKEKLSLSRLLFLHKKKIEFDIDMSNLAEAMIACRILTDYPKMRIPFDKKEMIEFFENEALKLKPQIFKN